MAKIICVTSCITGIAHTYMAAEALERAGKKLGHDVKVETQGAAGSAPFKQSEIDAADGVIFAVDLPVRNRERFNGKPYIEIAVSKAMNGAQAEINLLLEQIEKGTAKLVGDGSDEGATAAQTSSVSSDLYTKPKTGLLQRLFGKKN